MGSKAVWIINPMNRTARYWDGKGWPEATTLEVAGTPIYMELSYLWELLDGARSN